MEGATDVTSLLLEQVSRQCASEMADPVSGTAGTAVPGMGEMPNTATELFLERPGIEVPDTTTPPSEVSTEEILPNTPPGGWPEGLDGEDCLHARMMSSQSVEKVSMTAWAEEMLCRPCVDWSLHR